MRYYKCRCIFCMKEFLSLLKTSNVCRECMEEQEKATEEILKNDPDYTDNNSP